VSGLEQAAALKLLIVAYELLSDPLTSDGERARLAENIRRFIEHEPVSAETNPLCGRCGRALSLHEGAECPRGGGTFTHAATVRRPRWLQR
jgi:hypothetical protein